MTGTYARWIYLRRYMTRGCPLHGSSASGRLSLRSETLGSETPRLLNTSDTPDKTTRKNTCILRVAMTLRLSLLVPVISESRRAERSLLSMSKYESDCQTPRRSTTKENGPVCHSSTWRARLISGYSTVVTASFLIRSPVSRDE